MGLSRTVSEINGNFGQKSQNSPCISRPPPADGIPLGIGIGARGQKLQWWCYQMVKKVLR